MRKELSLEELDNAAEICLSTGNDSELLNLTEMGIQMLYATHVDDLISIIEDSPCDIFKFN